MAPQALWLLNNRTAQRQSEALALQRQQLDLYRQQLSRGERINDRAEIIQGRALNALRLVLWVALPVLAAVRGADAAVVAATIEASSG